MMRNTTYNSYIDNLVKELQKVTDAKVFITSEAAKAANAYKQHLVSTNRKSDTPKKTFAHTKEAARLGIRAETLRRYQCFLAERQNLLYKCALEASGKHYGRMLWRGFRDAEEPQKERRIGSLVYLMAEYHLDMLRIDTACRASGPLIVQSDILALLKKDLKIW